MSFSVFIDLVEGDVVTVSLKGESTVRNSVAIKAELLSLLQNYDKANIYLNNIARIDIAGLQLLLALKKSADAVGKSFTFYSGPSADVQAVLALSGFTHLVSQNIV